MQALAQMAAKRLLERPEQLLHRDLSAKDEAGG